MSNVLNNRLSVTVDPAAITEVKNRIEEINTLLPFLTGLTKDERRTLPKINRSNKIFVEDTLDSMRQNGDILPNFINVEEVDKDYALYNELKVLALELAELSEKVNDTRILAGSEAYSTSLLAYKMFGVAASSGVAGAEALHSRLKERFANSPSTTEEDMPDQTDQGTDGSAE
ncbi:hypothetical protein D1815_06345 [Aquimarina sp. AD1]|uniref:hypothetical protein n=1 Tax=Aquimarina sp. (strain AD1) TaxID=1714848 RepID=UPI000E47B1B4|nr:hypothetical protein [Aquimarina sp. AD1]AXT55394.1 hypothetical protein D1815_06345 [Aquimarina sp. AD1]RKN23227.1 hypothetical protein D7035_11490 [Aquimarina sp. AD1]